jgi:hypothetical protein
MTCSVLTQHSVEPDWPDSVQSIVEFPGGQPLTSTLGLKMNRLIICLSFLLACSSVGAEVDPLVSLKKGQPADVAAVLGRLVGCVHFAGEEGYDAERRREIATAMKKLKC